MVSCVSLIMFSTWQPPNVSYLWFHKLFKSFELLSYIVFFSCSVLDVVWHHHWSSACYITAGFEVCIHQDRTRDGEPSLPCWTSRLQTEDSCQCLHHRHLHVSYHLKEHVQSLLSIIIIFCVYSFPTIAKQRMSVKTC